LENIARTVFGAIIHDDDFGGKLGSLDAFDDLVDVFYFVIYWDDDR